METPNIIVTSRENSSIPYLKIGAYAVGGILVLGVGYKVYKTFFGANSGGTKNLDNTNTSQAPDVNKLKIEGSKLTITENDAIMMASTLFSSMSSFGTEVEPIINNLLKLKSKEDLMLVVEKFGLRRYFLGTYATFLGTDQNLMGWLNEELSGSDLKKCKDIFNNLGMVL